MIRPILTTLVFLCFASIPVFAQINSQDAQERNYAGQVPPQPQKTLWTLTCFQNGIKIIDGHAMTDFTYGTNSFSATLQKDGKIYVSGLDQNSGTVCQVIEYQQ